MATLFHGADDALHVDFTGLLEDPTRFREAVDWACAEAKALKPDLVVGIASKGHYLAVPVALALKVPFAVVKKGDHALGPDVCSLEGMHFWKPSKVPRRVLILDDLSCSGGTLRKAEALIRGAYEKKECPEVFFRTLVRVTHAENTYGPETAKWTIPSHFDIGMAGGAKCTVKDTVRDGFLSEIKDGMLKPEEGVVAVKDTVRDAYLTEIKDGGTGTFPLKDGSGWTLSLKGIVMKPEEVQDGVLQVKDGTSGVFRVQDTVLT